MRRSFLLGATAAMAVACSAENDPPPNGPGTGGTSGSGGSVATGGVSSGGAAATGGGGPSGGTGGVGATGGSGGAGGTGGTVTGGTGGVVTGGSGGTAGSAGANTGGSAGTGGTPATGFSCPPGSEALTVDLAQRAPSVVNGAPPAGLEGSFNLEGPVWIDGVLYLSEIGGGSPPPVARILSHTPGGGVQVFIADSGTNGLAVDADGALYGASHKDGSISRFDVSNPAAAPVVVASMYDGKRFNSPNDLAIRSDGNIYFSDPTWQAPQPPPQADARVYRIPAGGGAVEVVDDTIDQPNGVLLTKDENTLYVGGSGGLWKFSIMDGGAVGSGTRIDVINGGVDGLAKDCAGNLYVTNGQRVAVLNASDTSIGEINVGANVTNVAFGGAENRTLFITSMQPPALRQVELNVPGYPY